MSLLKSKIRPLGKTKNKNPAATYQAMLRREAALGGKLFGPLPKGHRREFFCLDKNTWVWHEEWISSNSVVEHRTTRYDVRINGVFKAQQGLGYQKLSADEASNFKAAVELYHDHVTGPLYGHAH